MMAPQLRAIHSNLLKRMPLKDLLQSCSSFRSSGERDMLFAILNMAPDTYGIRPSYNISTYEMWIAILKIFIQAEGKLVPFLETFRPILDPPKRNDPTVAKDPSWMVAARDPDSLFTPISSEERTNFLSPSFQVLRQGTS